MIAYNDQVSWGDVRVDKNFKLDSLSNQLFYITAKFYGNAILHSKINSKNRESVEILSNIDFQLKEKNRVLKKLSSENLITKKGKDTILTLSKYSFNLIQQN